MEVLGRTNRVLNTLYLRACRVQKGTHLYQQNNAVSKSRSTNISKTHLIGLSRMVSTSHSNHQKYLSTRANLAQDTNPPDPAVEYEKAMPFSSIPSPGFVYSFPYIGTRLLFKPFSQFDLPEIGHLMDEFFDKYGQIFKLRVGQNWIVMTENLDDAEVAYSTVDEFPFRNPSTLFTHVNKRSKEPLPYLMILNGPEWKKLRTPINARLLKPKVIEYYIGDQGQVAVEFADQLYEMQDTASPKEMQEMFFKFATESIGVIAFNKRLGLFDKGEAGKKNMKLLESYRIMLDSLTENFFGRIDFLFYDSPFYKRFKAAYDVALSFSASCLKEAAEEIARQEREGTLDPDEPNFLLSLLSDSRLSHLEVHSIVDTMLLGGSDSTACGLQLLFYNLAKNPEKQTILAEKVRSVLGKDGDVTPSNMNQLDYVKATVKESMRMISPIAAGVPQQLMANKVLSGYQVPKGTAVMVSNKRITKNPKYYYEPEQFLPERWLRDVKGKRQHDISTLAFLPFGMGPRMCPGRRIALQELYLAISKVVQKYEIGLKPDSVELRTHFTPFCLPKDPLSFSFKLRE